eukprot:995829-Pyramimonas_sp.AAC.1
MEAWMVGSAAVSARDRSDRIACVMRRMSVRRRDQRAVGWRRGRSDGGEVRKRDRRCVLSGGGSLYQANHGK